MTPGELAADTSIRTGKQSTLAKRWIALMRGINLNLDGKWYRVTSLANSGFSEIGVWWNDEIDSTHIRYWREVRHDLAHPPEDTRTKCRADAERER